MEALYGPKLGNTFRRLSDAVRRRVWLSSPFIGQWQAIGAILGASWWNGSAVVLRLITDINPKNELNLGTLRRIADRGSIRHLPGVHAKVYIFDDAAIVTSANLTAAGFCKRYEMGVLIEDSAAAGVINEYERWWNTLSIQPAVDFIERLAITPPGLALDSEKFDTELKPLWPLPTRPAEKFFLEPEKSGKFKGYYRFLANYEELANLYKAEQRIWPDSPLFLEVDAFLDYLFHHDERPSFPYYDESLPRKLTKDQRLADVGLRARTFAKWIAASTNEERWRERYSCTVRNLLARDQINSLTFETAKQVADCLNCMNARQLNKYKFLNSKNNSIDEIIKVWKDLLFGTEKEAVRLAKCDDALRFFGQSSVQELLGWFYPEQYPLRNSNSDAGLLYFGYDVL